MQIIAFEDIANVTCLNVIKEATHVDIMFMENET